MLLEDFINRHTGVKRNRVKFPSVIVPIMMIIGLFILVVCPLLLLATGDLFPHKFHLMFVSVIGVP